MGRKMTKLDNSNKLFLHTLGNQVGRAKIMRIRDIKKNKFINTIQTIMGEYLIPYTECLENLNIQKAISMNDEVMLRKILECEY